MRKKGVAGCYNVFGISFASNLKNVVNIKSLSVLSSLFTGDNSRGEKNLYKTKQQIVIICVHTRVCPCSTAGTQALRRRFSGR